MCGISCTVVDQTGHIAPAASGKAGGFLALDWNDDSPTGELTRRSFALHQELANELGADNLQHRRLTCSSIAVNQCVVFSGCGDPEVYVRPDNTAYCTAFPDAAVRVTEHPGEEEVRQEVVDEIVAAVRTASGGSDKGAALSAMPQAANACYLPMTPDGLPIIGLLPKDSVGGGNCYIATGHSCWGILLGPATGESMATLIATGKPSTHVDIQPFNPSRYAGVIKIQ
jgi:glycine/D-amino acid oxidase-like deaminating enzyme